MRSVRAILWRVCRNQDVRALLDRGAVKYVAWGNATLWHDVIQADVEAHEADWGMQATTRPGEEPTRVEAYRTEGYRGSSEIRVRTPPLISGDAHLVNVCRDNQAALDPDGGGDPTLLVALLVIDDRGEAHLRGALRAELPEQLRDAIDEKETDGRPFGEIYLDEREMLIAATLIRDHNVLLVGPPGTGKTRIMTRIGHAFRHGVASLGFDPDATAEVFGVVEGDQSNVFARLPVGRETAFLTFHPSLTYEDFMLGICPSVSDAGDLVFMIASGTLLRLAAKVLGATPALNGDGGENPERQGGPVPVAGLLTIDEFNRGNVPEIFGEVITLLEPDKRLDPSGRPRNTTVSVDLSLPASDVGLGQELSLPYHLYFLASMNSVDRSVAPIDSALRRRFRVIDVPPDLEVARRVLLGGSHEQPGIQDLDDPTEEEARCLAVALLAAVNERVRRDWGWEFELGHSYILGARDTNSLIDAWNETIRPHLNAIYRDGAELLDEWLIERDCVRLADVGAFDSVLSGEGAVTLRKLTHSPQDLALLHRLAWGQPPLANDSPEGAGAGGPVDTPEADEAEEA